MTMRKIGAAVAASLAVLAGVAAVAQAASFTADEYPATIVAQQVGEGVPPLPKPPPLPPGTGGGGGKVEEEEIENKEYEGPGTIFGFESKLMASCKTIAFSATLKEATTPVNATPLLSECRAFGFVETTVNPNGCEYRFHAGSGAEDEFTGSLDLVCPAGKSIVIQALTCEVQIGAQTGLGPITYENITEETEEIPKPSVGIHFKVEELAYTKTKDGFLCPLAGTGAKADGKILGGVFAAAENGSEKPIGLKVK